ncbi:hypothetical protein ACPCA8_13045 [Streptomyces capoamus]|uniref:hypothetical protein n=1 Tax=Streptomyces capoamus TaxID=68183 RepID=UPI003C2BEF2A
MTDRTSGPGDDRHRTERFTRPAGDEWTPEQESREQESPDRDEWAPGDASPAHRTPRPPRPEEHLPGEPAPGGRMTKDERKGEGVSEPVPGAEHGSEKLRLAAQEPGSAAAGTGRPGTAAGHGGTPAVGEEGRMPDDGLGAPAVGAAGEREAGTADGRGTNSWPAASATPAAPAASGTPSGADAPLLPHEETDRWERRLREVAVGFVDDPRVAVEEADRALEEITTRFTEAVTHRRRTLRTSWQGGEEHGPATETDTEQLRLALRDYRELAGRLLHG